MARILFGNTKTSPAEQQKSPAIKPIHNGDRDLLKKRSKKYVDYFSKLDHKNLTTTKGWAETMDALQEEFGSAALASFPLGILSKCFLGAPYEVHTLDLSGSKIIHHYKFNEPMSSEFEKARSLAIHDAYALIEVYTDKLFIIREDGTVTKL